MCMPWWQKTLRMSSRDTNIFGVVWASQLAELDGLSDATSSGKDTKTHGVSNGPLLLLRHME
jgi:hypothetical protein